ncbi:MAG: ABC transporter ATP-binding protein [Myxococcales bacterium]|nr:ABC transporter ATP-binding protein [Myxococcales bacterium]
MLIEATGLHKRFDAGGGRYVHALRGVDLAIDRGVIVGLVGESGCGKSTLGRCLLRLVEPDAGRIVFDGQDITALPARALRPLRRAMQIVLQDPGAALDPRFTAARAVAEPLQIHGLVRGKTAQRERAVALLERAGLAASLADRYPHQLSAGQRQRVCIARALAVEPRLIVADEPVSALDVSVQAQVLELLSELRRGGELSYLFISHDLAVVHHLADEIAVMYLGRIVERGPAAVLLERPQHPYTRQLAAAALDDRLPALRGEPPSPLSPPSGCAFRERCPLYRRAPDERCVRELPELQVLAADDRSAASDQGDLRAAHAVACHVVGAAAPGDTSSSSE